MLLADGTNKPIEDIDIGDIVLATEPETGQTTAKPVTATITGDGTKNLVTITIKTVGPQNPRTSTLVTTDGHPFWVPESAQWIDAAQLKTGQRLQTPTGTHIQITATKHHTQTLRVHNLTIADIHTYYVIAGNTPVLVHNAGCDFDLDGIQHAKDRHLKGGKDWDSNAGYFGDAEDFGALARGSAGQIGIRQENGNIKYIINAGRVVGIDKGKGTTFYTVIRDPYGGDLVTMFPGRG